ncbi:MAG: hypothetical protein ACOYH4_04905 [Saccharofermentanales bacterium]
MKTTLAILLAIMLIGLCVACSPTAFNQHHVREGRYTWIENNGANPEHTVSLTIQPDSKFVFHYDWASSLLCKGAYRIEDDRLIAETDDEILHETYVFKIIDADTLEFLADASDCRLRGHTREASDLSQNMTLTYEATP